MLTCTCYSVCSYVQSRHRSMSPFTLQPTALVSNKKYYNCQKTFSNTYIVISNIFLQYKLQLNVHVHAS